MSLRKVTFNLSSFSNPFLSVSANLATYTPVSHVHLTKLYAVIRQFEWRALSSIKPAGTRSARSIVVFFSLCARMGTPNDTRLLVLKQQISLGCRACICVAARIPSHSTIISLCSRKRWTTASVGR
jgi:hypothetical protein